MNEYLSDLVVRVSAQSTEDDGVLDLLFFGEEVKKSWQMLDEGRLDFEVFISIK